MKKIKFLFDEVPKRKCGTEAMLMIGGLTGLVGSFASSAVASGSSSAAIKANRKENQLNRDFNREEAEKSRDWSSQEWFRQFENQKQEWSRQFGEQSAEWYRQQDYSNQQAYNYWLQQQQYQSPEMQAQRYRDAGINPAAVVGQQSAGAGGLSAAPTSVPQPVPPTGGQVPSPQAATAPSPVAQPTESAPQMMQAFSSLIQSLGSFGKDSQLAKETESLLVQKFKLMASQVDGQELLNAYQSYENFIQPQLGDLKIQKENAELQQALAQAYLSKDMSKYYLAQAKLTKKLAKKEGIVAMHVDQLLSLVGDQLQASIANTKSQTALNQGNLGLVVSQRRLNQLLGDNQEYWNSLNQETRNERKQQIIEELNHMRNLVSLSGARSKMLDALKDKLEKETDWISFKALVGAYSDVVNANANAFKAATGWIPFSGN